MKIIIRILLLLIFLVANMHDTFAMQPMQWFRDVASTVQAELQAEDAAHATEELRKLAETFILSNIDKKELFNKTKQLLERGANPNVIAHVNPLIVDYPISARNS